MIRLSSQCCPRIPRLNGSASETSTAARVGEVISMLFVSTGHWPAHMLSTMNSPCMWLTCSTFLRDERFVYRFDSICTFLLRTVPQLPLSPFPGKDYMITLNLILWELKLQALPRAHLVLMVLSQEQGHQMTVYNIQCPYAIHCMHTATSLASLSCLRLWQPDPGSQMLRVSPAICIYIHI